MAVISILVTSRLSKDDFKAMRALQAEKAMMSHIVVCLESVPRDVDGIRVMPWETFLKDLWAGALK